MQIIGKAGTVNELGLRLGSYGTHFKLVMEPFDHDYIGTPEFKVSNDVLIHFQDTRELDTFIYMLQKFRARNNAYIGDWVEIRDERSNT